MLELRESRLANTCIVFLTTYNIEYACIHDIPQVAVWVMRLGSRSKSCFLVSIHQSLSHCQQLYW